MIGQKIKKSWNSEFLAPRIIKSRFYETKIDQNNSPELLNLLFKHICHKNGPTNATNTPKLFLLTQEVLRPIQEFLKPTQGPETESGSLETELGGHRMQET